MTAVAPLSGLTYVYIIAVCTLLTACGGGEDSASNPGPVDGQRLSAAAQLGEKIFHDPSLSASAKISCATCHDAGHAVPAATILPCPWVASRRTRPAFVTLLRCAIASTPAFYFDDEGTPAGDFEQEIDDLVAFLNTLSDGHRP